MIMDQIFEFHTTQDILIHNIRDMNPISSSLSWRITPLIHLSCCLFDRFCADFNNPATCTAHFDQILNAAVQNAPIYSTADSFKTCTCKSNVNRILLLNEFLVQANCVTRVSSTRTVHKNPCFSLISVHCRTEYNIYYIRRTNSGLLNMPNLANSLIMKT